MDEVLARAMTRKPEPIEPDEAPTTAAAVPEEAPVDEEERLVQVGQVEAHFFRASQPAKLLKSQPTAFHR